MAYVVNGSFSNAYYGSLLSATPASTPDHLVDDLIVLVVTQDAGSGSFSTSSPGWALQGTRTGTPAGLAYQQIFTKVATTNGTGEAPTITSTLNDDGSIAMFIVRDVDTANPVNAVSAQTDWNNVGFANSATVTTTNDECLILYFWGSDGIPALRTDIEDGATIGWGQLTAVTNFIGYRQQQTAGVSSVMSLRSSVTTEGGTSWVLAINNKAGGATAPDVRFDVEPISMYGVFGNATSNVTWYGPEQAGNQFAGGFTSGALGGLTVTAGAVTVSATSSGVPSLTAVSTSNVNNVLDGAWHSIPSASLLDKVFTVGLNTSRTANSGRIGSVGLLVGFTDGTNYEFFTALKFASNWTNGVTYRAYVLCGRSTPTYSRGALDWTAITGICYLLHHLNTAADSFLVSNAVAIANHKLTGGGSLAPVSSKDIPLVLEKSGFDANALAKLQSSSQVQSYFPLSIGDGTNKTYFKAAGTSTEYPQRLATTSAAINPQYLWDVPVGYSGITVYASALDTMDFSAGLFATDLVRDFTIHASSSTSATYLFSGASFIGWNVTWKTGVPCNGATFAQCAVIDFKGASINGVTANAGTGAALCAASNGFSATNCTFTASTTAVYGIRIADASAITLTNTLFNGFTKDIDVTATTGIVTINLAIGQAAPTYQTAGATVSIISVPVSQGLAFTGLVAGSQIKVFSTGTTTELFSTNSSSTSETWSQTWSADVTVDYTVMKAGYLLHRVIGQLVGAVVLSVPIQPIADRSYIASSGLVFGSTATVTVGTNRFTVTVPTTVQNWYSFMVESWIAQSALRNVAFPISSNGPNSFTLEGWEFSAGLSNLYRDGLRYTSAGVATAIYAAIYSVDTAPGLQITYQQADGTGTTNAATTGPIDQLVQLFGDAAHGNFDKRTHLTLKVQADGYDQAATDVVATYGALEDQLYVIGLNPTPNGLPTGAPTVAGVPTITDHGAAPVTWHGKAYSITITDSAAGNSGETLMRWIRYNLAAGGTFQGKPAFNWHDLVQTNGTSFKTVRGPIYGDPGAAIKGVRVITSAGADHPSFNLHTADDGTTYAPTFPANAAAAVLANSRVQLYNLTTNAEIDNQFVTGTAYSYTVTTGVSVGDTLRLRVCKLGRQAGEAVGLWTATGLTFLVSQPEDTIYTAWGIDGSNIPEFTGDVSGHIYIDANDLDGVTQKTRLGAWYSWVLTTGVGITYFYGGVTFLSAAEIRINTNVADILIENTNATTALRFSDTEVRLFRSDGSSIIAPTSYSIHNDYSGVPDYSVISVGGANVITGDVADVLAAIPSAGSNASAVRSNLAPELARIDVAISTRNAVAPATSQAVAAEVLAAAQIAPISANVSKIHGQPITGSGSEVDPWGP